MVTENTGADASKMKGEQNMATCLDDYQSMKDTMAQQFSEGNVSLEQSMTYQELLYRIGVLETCRMLCKRLLLPWR